MANTTRRRFLAEAADSAAGVFVWTGACAGVWPGLKAALAVDSALRTSSAENSGPKMEFPGVARERIAIASYPFRDFIVGREDKAGGGKMG